MADSTAGRNGASGDPWDPEGWLPRNPPRRWPVSAICCVAVLGVLVLTLLLMNLAGIGLGRNGDYDADMGGSVADWIGAIGTLVALPAAVLLGIRQLQSSAEALQLGQRQLEADRAERAERLSAELAALRSALRVGVEVGNLVDASDLATEDERIAVERWRHEYRQRGWSPAPPAGPTPTPTEAPTETPTEPPSGDGGGATWAQGSVTRSTAELLMAEASPLMPEPWFVVLTCRNAGTAPLTLQRLTVLVDGTATAVESREELAPGGARRLRLGPDVGLRTAYASRATAEESMASLTVIVDGCDSADRAVRIIHPPPE